MSYTVKPSPEWERYYADLARHELYIKNYRFFLDRIVDNLASSRPGKQWTAEEIRKWIGSEIDMASSCDAPNKPGYYRANND